MNLPPCQIRLWQASNAAFTYAKDADTFSTVEIQGTAKRFQPSHSARAAWRRAGLWYLGFFRAPSDIWVSKRGLTRFCPLTSQAQSSDSTLVPGGYPDWGELSCTLLEFTRKDNRVAFAWIMVYSQPSRWTENWRLVEVNLKAFFAV